MLIEQAKGILAASADLDMDAAFSALRLYSRNHQLRLAEVAEAIATRRLATQEVLGDPLRKG